MTQDILVVNKLVKYFKEVEAVKDISFSVRRGEIFSLLGPNGAGKTTTISMLSGLIKPTSGDATIGGHSITKASMAVKKVIGVVPQELALYNELSAQQNLMFWGQMQGMGGNTLKTRISELLERVTLSDRANDRAGTFSGGMKRRLNIAIGLLHKPELLFMDEPTVGIDPQSRRRILDMVQELRAEGMTVIYTTHYMEEAAELSDRVGIIDKGRLIAIGTQAELTKQVGEQEAIQLTLHREPDEAAVAALGALAHVATVSVDGYDVLLTVKDSAETLSRIISTANTLKLHISAIDIREPNLESVFLSLTGRGLRD